MTTVERNKIITSAIGIGLMCAGANVSVDLGNSTVPFILSDFFAVLVPVIVGMRWGIISVAFYLLLGALGLPVYADGAAGWQHLYGPSAGYLIGYLVAAISSGLIIKGRYEWYLNLIALIVGYCIIFTFGVSWLYASTELDLLHAYRVGLRPFWLSAGVKIFAAWIMAAIIAPRIDPPLFRA